MLNIKLGPLHMFFRLHNILLHYNLQSISDTIFFTPTLAFSTENHAETMHHWQYSNSKEISIFGLTLHTHQLEGSFTALGPHCALWSCPAECRLHLNCLETMSVFMHMDSIKFVQLDSNLVQISPHYIIFLQLLTAIIFPCSCSYSQTNNTAHLVTVWNVWLQDIDLLILP